jgi:hypothetical protein
VPAKIPGMVHDTIDSPSMKRKIGFNVYLPPGYKDGKKELGTKIVKMLASHYTAAK